LNNNKFFVENKDSILIGDGTSLIALKNNESNDDFYIYILSHKNNIEKCKISEFLSELERTDEEIIINNTSLEDNWSQTEIIIEEEQPHPIINYLMSDSFINDFGSNMAQSSVLLKRCNQWLSNNFKTKLDETGKQLKEICQKLGWTLTKKHGGIRFYTKPIVI
jgi:hypothetical protein